MMLRPIHLLIHQPFSRLHGWPHWPMMSIINEMYDARYDIPGLTVCCVIESREVQACPGASFTNMD